jgi:hypothetical protein
MINRDTTLLQAQEWGEFPEPTEEIEEEIAVS